MATTSPATHRSTSRVEAVAPASPPMAARHFAARLAFETDPSDLAADLAAGIEGVVVVDGRQPHGYAASRIPGAINLPHATIDEHTTAHLDPTALYVTYCWGPACNASTRTAANLAGLGFRVKELIGGLSAWQAEGFAVDGDPTSTEHGPVACAC